MKEKPTKKEILKAFDRASSPETHSMHVEGEKELPYNKSMQMNREEINVMQEALLRYSDEDIESDEFYSEEEVQRIKKVRDALITRSGVK